MINNSNASGFSSGFSDSPIDSVTSQFTSENICGEGASCIVYQMRLDGLRVAVKQLRPELLTNPTYVASYRKEYAIGSNLRHDALPIYRKLCAEIDEVYIVMDFVDGITLEDFIKTTDGQEYFKSVENVRRFFKQLISVVGYLHRSGVIHCDLKPANIMLRHSDRGLMLIDLDKAYCDTLDRTHGGTTNCSAPLPAGEKPTAQKDFQAIGKLLDVLSASPQFPSTKFKRFRSACYAPDATLEKLEAALHPRSHRSVWAGLIFIATVGLILSLTIYRGNQNADSSTIRQSPTRDTIVTIIQAQETQSPTVTEQPIKIDFDSKMTSFTAEAEAALSRLSDGFLSDSGISDLMMSLIEKYTESYNNIVQEAKTTYPQLPAIDVELAVARKSENSRASELLQRFTKAASDTINALSTGSD